jgi:hypothetical protein
MQGVKVVELAGWVVGPSVAGVLADWGAEVVKIEPPDGDPNRAWATDNNPAFELDNRGKLSVTLDVKNPHGKALALELIAGADVFVTNLRGRALRSLSHSARPSGDAGAVEEGGDSVRELVENVAHTDEVDVGIEGDELCTWDVVSDVSSLGHGDEHVTFGMGDQRRHLDLP